MKRFFNRRLLAALLAVIAVFAIGTNSLLAEPQPSNTRGILDMVLDLVQTWYVDPVDPDVLLRGAIKGALAELQDPYTEYFQAEDYSRFMESLSGGGFGGIGVYIDKIDEYITVISPIKGTPGYEAGLKPGDRILEVNGQAIVGIPSDVAVKLIRGEPGTVVKLKIERPSEGRVFEVEITRAIIEIPSIDYELREGNIGYIQLYTFNADTAEKFRAALDDLKAKGAKGLILDLRGNPGGYLHVVTAIAENFVPNGKPIFHTVSRGTEKETVTASRNPDPMPLVVLIDEGSASASELLSAAIKENGVGTLVGTKTFGKGSVQSLITFDNRDGLKMTTARYLTPNGNQVDTIGVQPDVVVEVPKPNANRTKPLEFTRLLSRGKVGLDVQAVQQRLKDIGNENVVDNGYYGPATISAVRSLQEESGLPVTGVVDSKTMEILNKKVADFYAARVDEDVQMKKALEVIKGKLVQ